MENSSVKPSDPKVHYELFVYYLNKIYFGKHFLSRHLEEIISCTDFNILKQALTELLQDVNTQITRMDEIYTMLKETPREYSQEPIRTIMAHACQLDGPDMPIIRDVDIMVHMQLVEHVNMISYRMLKKLAILLDYKEIHQLMTECFDESRDDDQMFLSIAKEYLTED